MDLDTLENLAKKATPGPWRANENIFQRHVGLTLESSGYFSQVLGPDNHHVFCLEEYGLGAPGRLEEKMQYIAACDPQTILALTAVAKAAIRVADETRRSPAHEHLDWCELYDAIEALSATPDTDSTAAGAGD